jgi:hypothetical protein
MASSQSYSASRAHLPPKKCAWGPMYVYMSWARAAMLMSRMQLFDQISTDKKTWSQQNFIDAYYTRLQFVGGPYPPECVFVAATFRNSLQFDIARRTLLHTGRTFLLGRAFVPLGMFHTTTLRIGTSGHPLSRAQLASASSAKGAFSILSFICVLGFKRMVIQ